MVLIFPVSRSFAQDTVATNDIEFTTIPAQKPAAVKSTGTSKDSLKKGSEIKATKPSPPVKQSLWSILLAGFIGGLAAVLMPCIFPMLPMTVSYFTKSSYNRAIAVRKALLYGISIIVIYVVFGLIITVSFGADALNNLATNGVFNFLFFLLLVVFAASFLGAFEITLPSRWVNKMDQKADKGGNAGIFFMAATLALVSFSCTGPIVGTLLVQAATSGALLGPATGMFGFSLALSIPFALFAMFPNLMQAMPKSGGWLNSVKVVLGFLELAFSLKFLSNVDLAYHWHWFDREVFLVLWIVLAALCGMYLLGKLRFAHDSALMYISVPRLFLSIVVLSFAVYMVPGLWGAPLKSVSAFLPPQASQDFDLYTPTLGGGSGSNARIADSKPHKYAELFDRPQGLNPFFDFEEGLAYARSVNKPVMIDFTGHACVNCRKMEASVWPDKTVYGLINNDYVLIQLYVDDKTDLPANEQYVSAFSGKKITTIGARYSDLQASKFQSNSQPFYVLLNPKDESVIVPPQGANYDAAAFAAYLTSGKTALN
ncbi:cytochrome c biogenesis protein CcdA [Mucilaginibacter sabulilitoris]|uniref:Cytochrome c biogenesis protein CcdA n=1 Tax=Mucilaginibacter sabulilitoris TaxID=1173583 RepID=A0ABZ0TY99_9SPHI|nr:cytochrome c biogenesis protein CcdA [Mucilaginibacter sabulilitoris]WPU97118.1 cytochrome c biogenesis protein CcdA [Mucilaginibacter sabulilitoris]